MPDKQDDPAFNDVYIVKGDPTNEVHPPPRPRPPRPFGRRPRRRPPGGARRRQDHPDLHRDPQHLPRRARSPNIAVECRNPNIRHHLLKAGADEIISSDELGLRLLARTALYHGMTRVYQELLTVGRDANEMYLLPVPEELVGRDFVEISSMFLRHRDDRRSCLLIGLQREETMILNPVGPEAGPIRASDQLILLSRVFIQNGQTLPTVPPVKPAKAAEPD